MRHLRLPLALLTLSALLLTVAGCDSADNPVAPSGSVLTITASPTQISLTGSATLTVTGFKPDGNPLNPGTLINLSTTLGVLVEPVAEVSGGRATTTLRGDGRSGTATVTATLPGGGETSATVDVLVGQTAETQPTLSITASPNVISLNESAEVTAVARNADGSLFGAGGQVNLRTDLGWLVGGAGAACGSSGASAVVLSTQSTSEAKATLCAGDQPGSATITGSIDSSMEATATVSIENQRPSLLLAANPSVIPVAPLPPQQPMLSEITIIARDQNGLPLGAGNRVRLTADLGFIVADRMTRTRIEAVETDSNGEAVVFFEPGERAGTGAVTALLDNSDPVSIQITIRDAPGTLSLSANPNSIQRVDEGIAVSLRATVRGTQGDAIGGIAVDFEADRGTLNQTSVTTNAQGEALVTLTVTRQDVSNVPQDGSFEVRATVTSEGQTLQEMVNITVLGAP